MMDIKVSITVITYNQEKYIRQCLDSLLNQKTDFDYEVIVAEDCSPDNTREILLEYKEKYGEKLVLILQETNVGPSKNSYAAKCAVRGKYIAFCEGDDYWTDENKLQKQYDFLENNPQYSAVASDYMTILPSGEVVCKSIHGIKKDMVKTMKHWLREGFSIHGCTLFARKDLLPFTTERFKKLKLSAPTMGDVITFTLLYEYGDIYVMKDVMAAHRRAGNEDISSFSFTNRTKAIKYTYMYYDIVKALEEYFYGKYDFMPLYVNRLSNVFVYRLIGVFNFSLKEFSPLFKKLDFSKKLMFFYRFVRRFVVMANAKLKRKWNNRK